MFLWKNMDNYLKNIPVTPSYLELWFVGGGGGDVIYMIL